MDDCPETPTSISVDSYYLRNAYDLYDHFQDKDFDLYEHLGDVHPPHYIEKRIDNKAEYESDVSAGREYTYSSAKDVLERLGFDSNTLFN
ncbi:MAG: hypothetical protein ACKPKO_38625, partial [Candidatus Fonsibacter sp.]